MPLHKLTLTILDSLTRMYEEDCVPEHTLAGGSVLSREDVEAIVNIPVHVLDTRENESRPGLTMDVIVRVGSKWVEGQVSYEKDRYKTKPQDGYFSDEIVQAIVEEARKNPHFSAYQAQEIIRLVAHAHL